MNLQQHIDGGEPHFKIICLECGNRTLIQGWVLKRAWRALGRHTLDEIASRCKCQECGKKRASIVPTH